MTLTIQNHDVERLATEVAELAGENATEAIRKALMERRERLTRGDSDPLRKEDLVRWLETEVWSRVPRDQIGRRLTADEEAAILGYGPGGV